MFDVDELLKNREKVLKYKNTPLQGILSDYLHSIVKILESKKDIFASRSIREY